MIELYVRIGSQQLKRPSPFIQFPAGEWHINDDGNTFVGTEIAYVSGTDVNDYVKLATWADVTNWSTAIIPYLPAARADKGVPRGADIYANLIPNVDEIFVYDVHSNYILDVIKKTKPDTVIRHFTPKDFLPEFLTDHNYDGIVVPDAGALERATEVADALDLPTFECTKKRDALGKLSNFVAPSNMPKEGNFLVVDDICDGGGTFIGLADAIGSAGSYAKLDLYVSHGIFSRGTLNLLNRFNKIITTNSLQSAIDNREASVQIIDIKTQLLQKV